MTDDNKKINLYIKKIMNDTDFEETEKFRKKNINAIECIGGADKTDIYSLWDARYKYLQPGVTHNSALALEIMVTIDKSCGIGINSFMNYVANIFQEEFKKENILSIQAGERNTVFCHLVVLPLCGRVIDSSKWVDYNGINKLFEKRILDGIAEKFHILSEIRSEKQDDVTGYSEELAGFIPEARKPEDYTEIIYDTIEKETQEQTDMPYDALRKITNTAIQYFTTGAEHRMFEQAQRGDILPEQFMQNVNAYLKRYHSDMTHNDTDIVLRKMESAVFGNYVLDQLIDDDAISDIKVIDYNKIRVKVSGKRKTSNLSFIDVPDYLRFIQGIAVRNGLDLSINAVNYFTDTISSPKFILRYNITTNYINSVPFPYLHIRKTRKEKYSMQELIKFGMMDEKIADFLIYQAKHGKGIIFTGKGASGKTTIMNTLLDYIPFDCSGLVIQESEELFTRIHPDLMFQHVVINKKNPDMQYTLKDLAINGLLTDLDYFVIGEIKGGEAMYFMNAAATGHKCWCSVHSPSSTEAIDKLADYVMYESKYNKEQAMYMLKELQYIVFMKDFKVCEISAITGWDYEKKELIYNTIYARDNIVA